jgi:hypothetical protein
MAALGVAPHIVEAVLNHRGGVISGVARIYNRHDFRAEKEQALTTWAAYLDQLGVVKVPAMSCGYVRDDVFPIPGRRLAGDRGVPDEAGTAR